MILVNVSYDVVTPESAEQRDFAECGMLSTDTPMTFRELVKVLRNGQVSCWPAYGDTFEWVTHDLGITRRGGHETQSLHFSRSNPERKARYWRLAFRAAGLLRDFQPCQFGAL